MVQSIWKHLIFKAKPSERPIIYAVMAYRFYAHIGPVKKLQAGPIGK